MSIREKIYTYYFYNYARMDYNLIAETENEEKFTITQNMVKW